MSAKGARREPGFYWVRPSRHSEIRVAEWVEGGFWVIGALGSLQYPDKVDVVLSDRLTPPKLAPRSAKGRK